MGLKLHVCMCTPVCMSVICMSMFIGCMCTNACMHLVVKDQPSVSFLRSFPFNFYLLLFLFYVCECFPLLCACSALRGRPSELQIVVGSHVVVGIF